MPRPYRQGDADALWELKREFELELATGTGDDAKSERYRSKLDDDYREGYFDWVERCVEADSRSIQVASREEEVVGYVFVLPESFAYIWDGAVLNEIYVEPSYRGSDVADALMDSAVSFARDQDLPLERLVLDVDRENERATRFYERHGFEHWGEMVARDLS